jgi:hypothetical protein
MEIISSVETVSEYKDVIKVKLTDGTDLYYYKTGNGIMVLGFPYVMLDSVNNVTVYLFIPLGMGQTNLPYILKTEIN